LQHTYFPAVLLPLLLLKAGELVVCSLFASDSDANPALLFRRICTGHSASAARLASSNQPPLGIKLAAVAGRAHALAGAQQSLQAVWRRTSSTSCHSAYLRALRVDARMSAYIMVPVVMMLWKAAGRKVRKGCCCLRATRKVAAQ
jgi:hypothetical protein